MRAELKRLHSPDVHDLKAFSPEDTGDVGFLLRVMIGPEGEDGEESFDVQVCTPKWLEKHCAGSGILVGRHHLVMPEYSYQALVSFITAYCDRSSGQTWQEVALQLSRLGKWEFEDYSDLAGS